LRDSSLTVLPIFLDLLVVVFIPGPNLLISNGPILEVLLNRVRQRGKFK
jgi:hypothetical protein